MCFLIKVHEITIRATQFEIACCQLCLLCIYLYKNFIKILQLLLTPAKNKALDVLFFNFIVWRVYFYLFLFRNFILWFHVCGIKQKIILLIYIYRIGTIHLSINLPRLHNCLSTMRRRSAVWFRVDFDSVRGVAYTWFQRLAFFSYFPSQRMYTLFIAQAFQPFIVNFDCLSFGITGYTEDDPKWVETFIIKIQ